MADKLLWKLLLACLAFTVDASGPSCRLLGELQRDLVCTAGDQDYVLGRGLVSDNNRTTGITLRDCRITDINQESFNGLYSLQYLDLSVNKIKRLRLGVLDGAKQVLNLNLSHNLLTTFPLGLFDQKPKLEILDLKGNRINELPLGIFDPFKNLRHLDLSSNALLGSHIDRYLFEKSRNIRFIDFSRNDMSGAQDNLLQSFQALDFLNLDRCSLKTVPKFATARNLNTMHILILSVNQITEIDDANTFMYLDSLQKLHLQYNSIQSLNENVFKTLKMLQIIYLKYNKLVQLPDTLFKDLPKLGNIDLSHNLIEVVPVNAFRGTALKNLNLSNNRITYLPDNFCLELRNSGARLSKFFFNDNPWQCACLREELREVKTLGIEYNGAKYNGEVPVCATTNEFHCKRHPEFNEFYIDLYYNLIKKN